MRGLSTDRLAQVSDAVAFLESDVVGQEHNDINEEIDNPFGTSDTSPTENDVLTMARHWPRSFPFPPPAQVADIALAFLESHAVGQDEDEIFPSIVIFMPEGE